MELTNFITQIQYNIGAFIEIIAIYIALVWVAIVVWVLRDITTRTTSMLTGIVVTLFVAITNFPGLILYLLVRPEQTLEEGKNKDLFYASILDKDIASCSHCQSLVRADFKFCPNCSHYLIQKCENCNKKINPVWKYCINCQHDLKPKAIWLLRMEYFSNTFKKYGTDIGSGMILIFSWTGSRLKHILAWVGNTFVLIPFDWISGKIPAKFFIFQLKLPKLNFKFIPSRNKKLKVMAETKRTEKPNTAVKIGTVPSKISERKSSMKPSKNTKNTKSKRGRPKGSKDSKPRPKRSDAGRSRGSYK